MKKVKEFIKGGSNRFISRARRALSNQRGDFYISDAVTISGHNIARNATPQ